MEKNIKALIIDDEKHCIDSLHWLLDQYCPEIEVVADCSNAEEGLQGIEHNNPNLIFLDVEMPDINGFEMLNKLSNINFGIIFTTGYDQYAIRAIRFGALDYLVKPVDKDELRTAIGHFLTQAYRDTEKQLNALLTHTAKKEDYSFQKIAFPTLHSYELIQLSDIVACESNSNYTKVYLQQGGTMVVSKTLKEIGEMLNMPPFFRLHHSFLVNLQYATRYIKGEGGSLVLHSGLTVPVSRNRKEDLLKIITHISP